MTTVTAFLLLQSDAGRAAGAAFGGIMMLVWLAIVVVIIAGMWKVFEKAGQPGWAVLIPFYNAYILLKIAGRPAWWLLLLLIPLVNVVIGVIVAIDVAKSFGQSGVFGFLLLFLLGFIGYPLLGFGDARYIGPSANPNRRVVPA